MSEIEILKTLISKENLLKENIFPGLTKLSHADIKHTIPSLPESYFSEL